MVDVISQLGAVSRRVSTEERDGEESHVQSLEQTYPSPIDDVWDAVTTPERIQRWFLPVSGELRLGGRYQLEGNAARCSSASRRSTAGPATGSRGSSAAASRG